MYITLARVAHMYYEDGKTQQEIANALKISRIRVSRMLQQARAENIVQISITYDGYFPDLEAALAEKYPTVKFVISESLDGSDLAVKRSIGSTAAGYLEKVIRPGASIAVGWGTTLYELARSVDSEWPDVTFIPIIGGQVNAGLDVHANSIAALMADRSGGQSLRFFAPAVADSEEGKRALLATVPVMDTLDKAANADIAVFSVGSPFAETTTISRVGYYTAEEVQELRDAQANCDIISISYYDQDGTRCGQALSDRTVSISEQQLRNIPTKICVAGGPDKREALQIALGLDLFNVLVTDDMTAKYLLGE